VKKIFCIYKNDLFYQVLIHSLQFLVRIVFPEWSLKRKFWFRAWRTRSYFKVSFREKWLISNTGISTSKNLTSKTAISNLNLTLNWIWGVGGGLTADVDRGCYDPILSRLTPFYPVLVVFLSKLNSKLPSVFVEITSVEVPVFEITYLYRVLATNMNIYLNLQKLKSVLKLKFLSLAKDIEF